MVFDHTPLGAFNTELQYFAAIQSWVKLNCTSSRRIFSEHMGKVWKVLSILSEYYSRLKWFKQDTLCPRTTTKLVLDA